MKEFFKAKDKAETLERLTGMGTSDREPVFTADGDAVIYTSGSGPEGQDNLWKLNLDSRQKTQMTEGGANSPSISPDGRYLAFVSLEEDPLGDIRVWDLISNDVYRVTSGSSFDGFPAWSQDGRNLFFSRYGEDTNDDGRVTVEDNPSIFRAGFHAEPDSPPPDPETVNFFGDV